MKCDSPDFMSYEFTVRLDSNPHRSGTRINAAVVILAMSKSNMDVEDPGERLSMDDISMQKRIDLLEERLRSVMLGESNRSADGVGHSITAIANPSPLGLFGFAVVSWLSGVMKIVSSKTQGSVALTGIFVGGVAQLVAGLLHYAKNNAHSATTFSLYGLHWIVRGSYMHALVTRTYTSTSNNAADATYFALLAVSTLLLWIPSLRMNKVLSATLLVVATVFVLDAVAAFDFRGAEITAGVLSCIAATMAFYLCTADLVNETWKRMVIPVFPHQEHRSDYHRLPYFPRVHYHKSVTASIHH